MSALIYNGTRYGLNGEMLAYVHAVTQKMFAQGENFSLGITATNGAGDPVRHFLWASPSIPIEFLYDGDETVQLDGKLFDTMVEGVEEFGLLAIGFGPLPYSFEEANAALDAEAGDVGE